MPAAVVKRIALVPIESPTPPTPSKSAEETDSESNPKREIRAVIPDAGVRVPPRPRDNRPSVDYPRIIGRDINYLRLCRLDDHGRALCRHRFLPRALEVSGLLSTLAHHFHATHPLLLFVVVR